MLYAFVRLVAFALYSAVAWPAPLTTYGLSNGSRSGALPLFILAPYDANLIGTPVRLCNSDQCALGSAPPFFGFGLTHFLSSVLTAALLEFISELTFDEPNLLLLYELGRA